PILPQAQQELVATPITTAGDVKRNHSFKRNTNINKQQGYCDCCEMKYKCLVKHIMGEEHQAFARDKQKYEGLDTLISEVPSTIKFLQTVLLSHCMQKQKETENIPEKDNSEPDVKSPLLPQVKEKHGCFSAAATLTPRLPDASTVAPLSLNAPALCLAEVSPSRDQLLLATDTDLASQASQADAPSQVKSSVTPTNAATKVCSDDALDPRPQAVVIRRPVPSGIFTSPRRPRQPTPNKTPRGMERSMVFRDSPIGSLQPSPCSGSPTVSVGSIHVSTPAATTTMGAVDFKKRSLPNSAFLVRAIDFTKANISACEQKDKAVAGSIKLEADKLKCAGNKEVVMQSVMNAEVKISTSRRSSISAKNVVRRLAMENVNSVCEVPSDQFEAPSNVEKPEKRKSDHKEISKTADLKEASVISLVGNNLFSDKKSESTNVIKTVSDETNIALTTLSTHPANSTDVKQGRVADGICDLKNSICSSPKPNRQRNKSVTPVKVTLDHDLQTLPDCTSKSVRVALRSSPDKRDRKLSVASLKSKSSPKKLFKSSTLSAGFPDANEHPKDESTSPTKSETNLCSGQTPEVGGNEDEILKDKKAFTKLDLQTLKASCDGDRLDSEVDNSTPVCESEKVENINKIQMPICESSLNESPRSCPKMQRKKGKKFQLKKHAECSQAKLGKTQASEIAHPAEKGISIEADLKHSVATKEKETVNGKFSSSPEQVDSQDRNPDKETTEASQVKSTKRLSRFCKQFTYKGLYANSGLGLEEATLDLSSVVVPNIAERVKSRMRAVCQSEHLVNDAESEEVSTHDNAKVERRSKGRKRRRPRSGHSERLTVKDDGLVPSSVKKIKTDEDKEGTCESNITCDIVVPNIAECVKRRRSCTLFNHEGQYANDGEGNIVEQLTAMHCVDTGIRSDKLISDGYQNKKTFKQELEQISEENKNVSISHSERRHGIKHANEESSNNTDHYFPGFPPSADHSRQSSAREHRAGSSASGRNTQNPSDRSPAVVIRRRKSLSHLPYSLKQRPDIDWGKAQENPSSAEQVEEGGENTSQDAQDSSTQSLPPAFAEKQKSVLREKTRSKDSTLHARETSTFGSPRLKLKLKRLPSNEGYSSVLEEYHEDQELYAFTQGNNWSKDTSSAGKARNLATLQNRTPKKECNSDADSVDLLLSSPQISCKSSRSKSFGVAKITRNDCELVQKDQNRAKLKSTTLSSKINLPKNEGCISETKKKHLKYGLVQNCDEFKSQVRISSKDDKPKVDETVLLKQAGLDSSVVDSKKMKIAKSKKRKEKRLRTSSSSTSPISITNKKVKLTGSWQKDVRRASNRSLDSEYDPAGTFRGFPESPVKHLHSDMKAARVPPAESEVCDGEGRPSTAAAVRASKLEKKDEPALLSEENLTDYLALVPTFSSPGKATDSSWGDVCDLYISTSVKKDSQPSPLRSPKSPGAKSRSRGIHWSLSPKKLFLDAHPHHRRVNSPGKSSAAVSGQAGFVSPRKESSRDAFQNRPGNRTPSKRASNQHQSQSPVIHVDRVISFNMMSPQKYRSNASQGQ
ncbi:hypothetical protein EGW08_013796, partial [Elysia chlorotica]